MGRSLLLSENIINYTTNPFRCVDLKAQLAHGVDPFEAAAKLRERLKQIPNVIPDPPPHVEIVEFTLAGPVLSVNPFCHNNNYWQVFFDTNKAIAEVGAAAGYPPPWIPEGRPS